MSSIPDNTPDRAALHCPAWCTSAHRHATIDEITSLLDHSVEVGTVDLPGYGGTRDQQVSAEVMVHDHYEPSASGMVFMARTGPTITVRGTEDLTADQATEVAGLLLEAAAQARRIGTGR